MATKIRAAVFDVDGTLLDTREFMFYTYEHILTLYGYPVPDRTVVARLVGLPLDECYRTLAPEADIPVLMKAHREFQVKHLDMIESYDGLHEMLERLHAAGIKMGVFSSRKAGLVESLELAGISGYFESIVKGEDIVNHKPHPEGLLRVLDELDVEPCFTAMIGDAVVDIQAGKAADVAVTVGITHGFGTQQELEDNSADYIIKSLEDISILLLY